MNVKEFLTEGGRMSFPYKRELKEWVGEAKLYIFPGYYSKPKVIFENGYERLEWPLDEIDNAIKHFETSVFSPVNLMYKMQPSVIEVMNTGQHVDLDDEEDFEKVNTIRKMKVAQAIKITNELGNS
jgi:hypothetical protein